MTMGERTLANSLFGRFGHFNLLVEGRRFR
jgi:hypothetical protein